MSKHRLVIVNIAFLLAAGTSALAHDFWIRPSTFAPDVGGEIAVALEIGHAGESEGYARNPARIEKFVIAGPGAEGAVRDILGAPGAHPAGQVAVPGGGVYVIGYRSNHAKSELAAEKFESYLREEGLHKVVEARAAAGESGKSGVEVYSRCAKSLVRAVGAVKEESADAAGAGRVLGFTLELVPVGDPTVAKVGDAVTFRLLMRGEPVAGAKVEFSSEHRHDDGEAHGHEHESARTSADGTVSFTIADEGLCVVNCVVMERADASAGADWESWWASLTFGVGGSD
jgi:uncharacterized GH25 family protein